ncbi:hypothetical protein [Metallibacterium scheffleri]
MDGSLAHAADTLRAYTDRAISHIGDRARRAALREGLYQPCTWLVFETLGPAGQAGALSALAFCRDADEVADAVQAAALLTIDPDRQAAAARAARDRRLAEFDVDDPEAMARNGCSKARREHQARARSAEVRSKCAELPEATAGDRRRREPPTLEEMTGAPLLLLLRAEDEAETGDVVDSVATLGAAKPRPRGRPTRGEILERAGQIQLPGLPPGGSTTQPRDAAPPPAPTDRPDPAPPGCEQQLDLFFTAQDAVQEDDRDPV